MARSSLQPEEAPPETGSQPAVARPRSPEPATRQLDRLIHERVRLGIVSALAVNE